MSDQSHGVGRPRAERLRIGNVGPADPRADPATDPVLPVARTAPDAASAPTVPVPSPPTPNGVTGVGPSRTSGLRTSLILSAVVLLILLVFILQNLEPVDITFLGMSGSLPTGVALLLAAIAGVLLVAIPGTVQILQLRRAARRGGRSGR